MGSTSTGGVTGRVVSIPGALGLGTLLVAKAVTVREKMNTQARTAANTFFIGEHQPFIDIKASSQTLTLIIQNDYITVIYLCQQYFFKNSRNLYVFLLLLTVEKVLFYFLLFLAEIIFSAMPISSSSVLVIPYSSADATSISVSISPRKSSMYLVR